MAAIGRILGDESSAIGLRPAAIASIFAAAGVAAGIFLTIVANQMYEQSGRYVLWALTATAGATVA
jgi:hypothetical protein